MNAETINTETIRKFAADPVAFAKSLRIPTPTGPVVFGDVMAEPQERLLAALAPSYRAVALGKKPPIPRAWVEMTMGWGKDLITSIFVLWALAFSNRRISIRVYAVDQEQARLVKQSADGVLDLNQWLGNRIESQTNKLIAPNGSEAVVAAADSQGDHGQRIDIALFSELCRFPKPDVWDVATTNISKNKNGFLQVITNAGDQSHFSYLLRKHVMASDRWFTLIETSTPPWQNPDDLKEQESIIINQLLVDQKARGIWTMGNGTSAISPVDLAAAVSLPGPIKSRRPNASLVIGGVDIGVVKDASSFVVLSWVPDEDAIYLDEVRTWRPTREQKVDLRAVEREIIELCYALEVDQVRYDRSQAEQMMIGLQYAGIGTGQVSMAGKTADRLAGFITNMFRQHGKVRLFPHRRLENGISQLKLETRPWGVKLELYRDSDTDGHHHDETSAFLCATFGILEAIITPPAQVTCELALESLPSSIAYSATRGHIY